MLKQIIKKFVEIFYKRKYVGEFRITRVLCFRFKKHVKNNDILQMEGEILYQNENKIILYTADGQIINNPKKIEGLNVSFAGCNNVIEIYEPCLFRGLSKIDVYGNNCKCIFNKCTLIESDIKMSHSAYCFIDEGSTVHAYIHLACEKDLSLKIGKDCMFAADIAIWATDGHIIRDIETNEIINYSKNGIEIGDHCWIGYRSLLLKNTVLPNNTIVGAGSIVNHRFTEPNTIIAGNPAKVLKRNITWEREGLV